MNVIGDITAGTVFSGSTLALMAGAIWKVSAWKTNLETSLKKERTTQEAAAAAQAKLGEERRASDLELRKNEREAVTAALSEIKSTLGNGAPGTVVRTIYCDALHAAVADKLQTLATTFEAKMNEVHEDIRSLHKAVRELN